MSRVIPSEELQGCESWQLPEMGMPISASSIPESKPDQQLLTAGELEDLQEEARQEGYIQGLEEGRSAGLREMQERAEQLQGLIKVLDKPFEQLDETVETQLVQLAMIVARQMVRRELKTDRQQVIAVVKESLRALPVASRHIQLVLHPEDASLVREELLMEEEQNIQVIEDPVQTRGGCQVLTKTSLIDATVESRLNAIIANVLGGERASDPNNE
ncbi:MAG: flagellar assembly protein FliH [Gammaproteobacteria bacterium]